MGKVLTIVATGIFFVLKFIFWLLKCIVTVLGDFIIFFGLYIPGLYLIFGALLVRFSNFSFTTPSTDLNLFFMGLGLSVLCAVIITIRNLVVKPFKAVFGKTKEKTKENIKSRPRFKKSEDKPRRQEENNSPYPLIYRSEIYPEITVHEYEDRFDLYRDSDDELGKKFVRTEYKN
ncbi:MAG: hypothetical protein IJF76_02220 [Clostridia bacterium]|nr:hypothetical protein [Clostridia bacterium]